MTSIKLTLPSMMLLIFIALALRNFHTSASARVQFLQQYQPKSPLIPRSHKRRSVPAPPSPMGNPPRVNGATASVGGTGATAMGGGSGTSGATAMGGGFGTSGATAIGTGSSCGILGAAACVGAPMAPPPLSIG